MGRIIKRTGLAFAVAVALGIIGYNGGFGSRGTTVIKEFHYQGKRAELIKNDVRFGPDTHYIQIIYSAFDEDRNRTCLMIDEIYSGFIRTDEGQYIMVYPGGKHSIK